MSINHEAGVLATELEAVVDQAIVIVNELLELLESELSALKSRDAQALTGLSELKQAKIQSLEQIDTRRRTLLKSNGYGTDSQGMEQCIDELGYDALSRAWKQLDKLLSQLQKRNRINGSVVNLTQRFVERSLNILQGRETEDRLYDPSGQKTSERQARSIAKI